MNNLFLLVKVGMQEQFKIAELKNKKNKSMRRNTLLLSIVFVVLGLMIMAYAGGSAYGLIYMKMENLIAPTALTATFLLTLFFTMVKTNGILFGYHNFDTLASLPVKMQTLVSSRFMQLYIPNLIFSILIMLPMGLVYGIMCGKPFLFYLLWLLSIPAAPLIPTTIAALIGALIMAISSRMRHPQTISAILSILLVVIIMAGSTILGSVASEFDIKTLDMATIQNMNAEAETAIFTVYPMNRLFLPIMVNSNLDSLLPFALYLAISYIWYLFFVKLTSHFYIKIQSSLTSVVRKHHGNEFAKVSMFTQHTPFKAIFYKEWKRFLNSNIYFMNMGIGAILVILFSLAMLFLPQDKIMDIFAQENIVLSSSLSDMIAMLSPFIISALLGMSCSACCSLSLEGKNIEILRSLPITPAELYRGKMATNLAYLIPVSLLCSLLISIKYGSNVIQIVLIFLLPLCFSLFTAVWGMLANILFPNYSWENEVTVVKQSVASFCGLFAGLLLAVLSGVLVFNVPKNVQQPVTGAVAAVVLLLTFVIYQKVCKSPIPEGK